MKNFLSKATIIAFTGLTFLTACNKDPKSNTIDSVGSPSQITTVSKSFFTWSDAANPENPYDKTGYLHNKCLMHILSEIGDNKMNASNIYKGAFSFVEKEYGQSTAKEFLEFYEKSNFSAFAENLKENDFDFEHFVTKLDISPNAKNKLNILIEFTREASTGEDVDFNSFKEKIIDWELDVMSEESNKADEALLLNTSSILRYSLLGWSDGSFASAGSGVAHTMRWKWWKWAIVGLADAGGGLAAGVLTGGNPVLIVAGAAVGSGGASILL